MPFDSIEQNKNNIKPIKAMQNSSKIPAYVPNDRFSSNPAHLEILREPVVSHSFHLLAFGTIVTCAAAVTLIIYGLATYNDDDDASKNTLYIGTGLASAGMIMTGFFSHKLNKLATETSNVENTRSSAISLV